MGTDKDEILVSIEAVRAELKQEIDTATQKLSTLSTSNQTVLIESITRLSNELFLIKTRDLENYLTLKDYLERILQKLDSKKP